MKKVYFFSIVALLFCFALSANITLAQEPTLFTQDEATTTDDVGGSDEADDEDDALAEDESVDASDLGIEEPRVLPDSPWYGLKKFWEGIRDVFVFNPIVKAERSLDRASERLIEMQAMIDDGEIKNVEKVIANYERHIEKIKERIEKLEDVHSEKAEKFLDKFAEYQIKHRTILENIEEVSANPESIIIAKERAIEALTAALERTDNEKIKERLEKAIERVDGSELRQFKNLEVLKAIEEKVSESAKGAIIEVRLRAMERLKEGINKLPAAVRAEMVEKYIEKVKGDDDSQLEIIEDLENEGGISTEVRTRLRRVSGEIRERIRIRQEERDVVGEDE